uniref:asparagine synthase (glutamine-hydrolyzing) n=1 Tax=viral metagenome TaxID=1070528 RepID=A0A6C0I5J0_9ZZZZ
MCGIFFALNKQSSHYINGELNIFETAFNLLNKRGPDTSSFIVKDNKLFGFKRLAINDLSPEGNQPFFSPLSNDPNEYKILSMCNGELYNHSVMESKYKLTMKSHSDCECIIPLYKLFTHTQNRIERKLSQLFNEIDGVFAMVIDDIERNKIIVARDRIGVKPLFIYNNDKYFIVSSEAKTIDYILQHVSSSEYLNKTNIVQLPPRSFGIYNINTNTFDITEYFNINNFLIPHTEYVDKDNLLYNYNEKLNIHINNVHNLLYRAVYKRLLSDRPIGCLLSGGVDSSIIASVLSNIYKRQGKKIKTFSIGFPDSTDLKYARIVADHIQSDHHEYIIQYEDALKVIPEVINTIETYDITTIRASTPMYLLCKWIKENYDETVIFSGEGSDEVFGGYLYFHNAPDSFELHRETIRLVSNLHVYDVLRADRCTSGNSLELREPFLDRDLVNYVCDTLGYYKQPLEGYEKYLLRKAFKGYLPSSVLWRKKAAFSDAVSGSEKPWYKYIQEYCETLISDEELDTVNRNKDDNEIKFTKESLWYYNTFKNKFPCYDLNVQYWLPKWCNTTDPSATTINNVYNKKDHE